jgi:hypothetical protein
MCDSLLWVAVIPSVVVEWRCWWDRTGILWKANMALCPSRLLLCVAFHRSRRQRGVWGNAPKVAELARWELGYTRPPK